jgi:hypothetical protein
VVESVSGGEGGVAVLEEGKTYKVAAGDDEGGLVVAVDADDAALSVEAGGDVEVVVGVNCHALGAAEALVEDGGVAVAVDGVDGLVGGGGGAGDEECSGVVEGEMVGGDAGFERGVDEDLAAGAVGVGAADLEDGAGAVADEEVAVAIEGDAGGDAHAFGVSGHGALGGDAIDGAFGAGAGVEVAVGTEGEAGGVHEVADEGANLEVALNLEDRHGNGLAARAGDGGVDVAVGIDRRVGDGVEIFCHGYGDAHEERVAGLTAAMQDQIAGDGSLWDADGGMGGTAEQERSGDVADGRSGDDGVVGFEVGAVNLDLAPGHGREGFDAVEMRCGCVGLVGGQERTKCGHGCFSVDRGGWECKVDGRELS